ncbi:Do family serine endopeptidase [Fodinibius sp. Rm-B-1B1-1]|uniref:Do family serine endopeptidase n=1 Tax=Fodinibius alkaliphilus TaxID=3140241 RepID=UPI003159B33C
MKQVRSSNLLWAFVAVLVVGFYTVDLETDTASMISLPNFTSDTVATNTEQRTKTSTQQNKAPSKTITELNDTIVKIADETKQAVVTVKVTQKVEARPNPFSQFFGNPRQEPQEYERRGHGSGVIVSKKGYILTNNHVVENANKIEITLFNDKTYDAEIVGSDPLTDIAVLKIDASNLNVIKLGNSEQLRVGEMVLAIGSPLEANLAHSVSMGIISAKERRIGILEQRNAGYENFIQTDAAINPGNSGGALVNMDGELVGVNSAIASRSGGSDGIGFAVPVDIAKRVMQSIIENGRVVRGFLGITSGGEVDGTMAKALDLDKAYGVIVGQVKQDGPADKAGLKEDDIIQTMNGEPIRSWGAFRTKVATSSPGTEVELEINRDGNKRTLSVTLGELSNDEMAKNSQQQNRSEDLQKKLGFSVENLSPRIAEELELNQDQDGVVVAQISQQSEAYQQGLRRGHVITEIDRNPISNERDFMNAMNNIVEEGKDVVLLRVTVPRSGSSQLIAFEL